MHITILMHTYKTLSPKNPGTMTFTQIFTLFLYMYIHMHTYQPLLHTYVYSVPPSVLYTTTCFFFPLALYLP